MKTSPAKYNTITKVKLSIIVVACENPFHTFRKVFLNLMKSSIPIAAIKCIGQVYLKYHCVLHHVVVKVLHRMNNGFKSSSNSYTQLMRA